MFEQKFGFSLVVFLFTCGNFTLIFTVFSDFYLSGFPNPFTAHSRPSFLFELYFHFSLLVVWFMRHFDIDFLFLLIFYLIFFLKKNGFLNSLIVHSRSSFSVKSMKIL